MPRKNRMHIPADAPPEPRMVPKHLTKQQFGNRLYRLMLSKGWTQSELARQADLPRDSISVYIRGKSLPTPQSLQKLATALGAEADDLLPNHVESAIDEENPAFEMKQSLNTPGKAWLRVNRLVSMETALKIAGLLSNDDVASNGD